MGFGKKVNYVLWDNVWDNFLKALPFFIHAYYFRQPLPNNITG
jgi:hypothetical protein